MLTILLLQWGILWLHRKLCALSLLLLHHGTRRSSCTTDPSSWMTGLHSKPCKDYILFWELLEQVAGRTCRESWQGGRLKPLECVPWSRTQFSSCGLTTTPQAPSVQLTSCSTSSWTTSLISRCLGFEESSAKSFDCLNSSHLSWIVQD